MSGGRGEESGRVLGFDPVEDSLPGSWPDVLRCYSPDWATLKGAVMPPLGGM